MFSELFSADSLWAVLAVVLVPAIGSVAWYAVTKINHLYSKVAEINTTLAERGTLIKQYEKLAEHVEETLGRHDLELRSREHEINFLFWEMNKDRPNEQSKQAPRPFDR